MWENTPFDLSCAMWGVRTLSLTYPTTNVLPWWSEAPHQDQYWRHEKRHKLSQWPCLSTFCWGSLDQGMLLSVARTLLASARKFISSILDKVRGHVTWVMSYQGGIALDWRQSTGNKDNVVQWTKQGIPYSCTDKNILETEKCPYTGNSHFKLILYCGFVMTDLQAI